MKVVTGPTKGPCCLGKKHGDWFDLCDDCMETWLDGEGPCHPLTPPDDPTEAEMDWLASVPYDAPPLAECGLCRPGIPCYQHVAYRRGVSE